MGYRLAEGFLGLQETRLRKAVVSHKGSFGFQQALPSEGEEFGLGKSQPLGWGGEGRLGSPRQGLPLAVLQQFLLWSLLMP